MYVGGRWVLLSVHTNYRCITSLITTRSLAANITKCTYLFATCLYPSIAMDWSGHLVSGHVVVSDYLIITPNPAVFIFVLKELTLMKKNCPASDHLGVVGSERNHWPEAASFWNPIGWCRCVLRHAWTSSVPVYLLGSSFAWRRAATKTRPVGRPAG